MEGLALGSLLGGRYRIERRAWTSDVGEVFAGRDRVLDREVLVFRLPFPSQSNVTAFASRYAQVQHPDLLRVYDAVYEDRSGWLIAEAPPGGRLVEHIGRGPLAVGVAARIVRDLAAALGALHAHGLAHGAVGPDLVLLDSEGRTKLAGAGLGLATADPKSDARPADIAALGALAWRVFTGTAPGTTGGRVPPPSIAAVLERLLAGDPDVRPTLEETVSAMAPYVETEPAEREPGFLRQEAKWLAPALFVVALGIAAVVIGFRVDFGGKGFLIKISRNPVVETPVTVAKVTEFDPQGSALHRAQAPLAADGNQVSQWTTVGYLNANFGGLKKGHGLVFDLGSSRRVDRIRLLTSLPGWTAQWRVADAAGATADAFRTVAAFTSARETSTALSPPASGRYWLLWITSLVTNASGDQFPYQAVVNEVQFFAP